MQNRSLYARLRRALRRRRSSVASPPASGPVSTERFTMRARRALHLAQEEAQRLQQEHIDTEHLLLGLLREDGGVAAQVLANLDVELASARRRVVFFAGRGAATASGERLLTPRAKHLLEIATREARRFDNPYVGTEHLLLAIFDEGDNLAARVLTSFGLDPERLRAETLRVLAERTDA